MPLVRNGKSIKRNIKQMERQKGTNEKEKERPCDVMKDDGQIRGGFEFIAQPIYTTTIPIHTHKHTTFEDKARKQLPVERKYAK